MASDPVRIGVIGAGRMGRVHVRALERTPGVAVAGVADPSEHARAVVAARGHRACATVDELLDGGGDDGDGVEAVLIAAPSDAHLSLVSALAARGVPMLCEKPVGVRASEAAAAAAVAAEHGVTLQVGYWRRFVPELRALRERIAGGAFGEIYQLSCHQWDGEPPGAGFRAHSGGIAIDMGVHEIDEARWLTGQEFTWIAAVAGDGSAPSIDPDAATILGALSAGTAALVSLGRRFPDGDCCWLEIFGTRGHEHVPFMWGAAGERVFLAALRAQAEAFAATVRGGAAGDRPGGEDAVAALTVAECIRDALADGQRHEVPVIASVT